MKQSKKTGLFFGSYNPVHVGHLALASYMAQYTNLDEVWFVISPHNPFKEKKSLLADHHRLELVRIGIGEHPNLKACDIEFKLPQPSYTINTLTYLQEKFPEREFALICGTDILPSFHKWKNADQILNYYDIYVYNRPGEFKHSYAKHLRFHFIDAPMMEISSSFIRKGIKSGLDMSYFLPENIYKYIKEMNFYKK
ncbi:MAG: nicotinate-nucleotide adenylyltransferase [Bacteroidales bacterium]|nr:nicotinate-nucleotide adenylyltransferase [Bacteroidales bacterium]